MPSNVDPLPLINPPTPARKGPPPLPKKAAPARPPSLADALFEEGVDGRAESLPPSGQLGSAVGVPPDAESHEGWFVAVEEEDVERERERERASEAEIEDPMRTRRRRVARIGVAWGAIVALALAGAAAFAGPRRAEQPVATNAAHVETARAPVTAPVAASPRANLGAIPAKATPSRSSANAKTASAKTTAAAPAMAHGAAAAHGVAAKPVKGAAPGKAAPKASTTHAKRAATAVAPKATPARPRH